MSRLGPIVTAKIPRVSSAVIVLAVFTGLGQTSIQAPDENQSRQGAPARQPSFRVKTTVYRLDAVVTDKNGRQVNDLRAEDFEVVTGKQVYKPEHCTYFPLETTRPSAGSPGRRLTAPEVKRVIVFVISAPAVILDLSNVVLEVDSIDMSHLTIQASEFAARMLRTFVDEQMQADDLVMVIRVDTETGVLSQLTGDREVLRACTETLAARSLGSGRPTRIVIRADEGMLMIDSSRLMAQNLRAINTISRVIDHIKALPGRKIIVFGSRFMMHQSGLSEGSVVAAAIRELTQKANTSGVSIYTIDLRGLDVLPAPFFEQEQALVQLADDTGGRAFLNRNDFSGSVADILEENRGYYLLGFRIGQSDPEPKKIRLRIRRPGSYRIRARTAALPGQPSPTPTAEERITTLLESPLDLGDLPLDLVLGMRIPEKGPPQVVSFLRIAPEDLRLRETPEKWQQAELRTVVWVTDPKGRRIFSDGKTDELTLTGGALESLHRDGLIKRFTFPAVDPGFYQVSVAVADLVSGKTGNAASVVRIPAPGSKRPSICGLLLKDASEADYQQRDRVFFPPFRFTGTTRVRYECAISCPQGEQAVTVDAQVTQAGKVVRPLQSRDLERNEGSLQILAGDFDVGGLAPGAYELVVQLTGARSPKGATRAELAFDVTP